MKKAICCRLISASHFGYIFSFLYLDVLLGCIKHIFVKIWNFLLNTVCIVLHPIRSLALLKPIRAVKCCCTIIVSAALVSAALMGSYFFLLHQYSLVELDLSMQCVHHTALKLETGGDQETGASDVNSINYEDSIEAPSEIQYDYDYQYIPDLLPRFTRDMLAENCESCLFYETDVTSVGNNLEANDVSVANSPDYIELIEANNVSDVNSTNYEDSIEAPSEIQTPLLQKMHRFQVLREFAHLMSALKIKAVLIEPSILFCMLSKTYKEILLKRKFQPEMYDKSNNTVTFGIREKYVYVLEESENQKRITDANFTIEFTKDLPSTWMKWSKNVTNHVFFLRGTIVVHVVVFHKRQSYLWHGGMAKEYGDKIPPKESLHFADSDSAYDSFTPIIPGFRDPSLSSLLLPSSPQHLLFQMNSSRFLECSEEVQQKFREARSLAYAVQGTPEPYSPRVQRHFKVRTVAAISALKNRLAPLMMKVWMCSGTLLGWWRECGLIPYTNDVDFATFAEEVDDLGTLLQLFEDDGNFRLKERMGVLEEGLEFNLNYNNLRVDLFFFYRQSNGSWYPGHRPSRSYYVRYHLPHFTLCSADLLGRLILAPCEPEKILVSDYGPNWTTPVRRWNYEWSPWNRGPNIYWNDSMKDKVYFEEN